MRRIRGTTPLPKAHRALDNIVGHRAELEDRLGGDAPRPTRSRELQWLRFHARRFDRHNLLFLDVHQSSNGPPPRDRVRRIANHPDRSAMPQPLERLGVAVRSQRINQVLRLHEMKWCSRSVIRRLTGPDIYVVDDQQVALPPRPKDAAVIVVHLPGRALPIDDELDQLRRSQVAAYSECEGELGADANG